MDIVRLIFKKDLKMSVSIVVASFFPGNAGNGETSGSSGGYEWFPDTDEGRKNAKDQIIEWLNQDAPDHSITFIRLLLPDHVSIDDENAVGLYLDVETSDLRELPAQE
jgi:hypothetical protein